jgi:hypothetical protein
MAITEKFNASGKVETHKSQISLKYKNVSSL